MISRLQLGIVLLIVQTLVGCGSVGVHPSAPSAPTSTPPVVTVRQPWPPGVFTPHVSVAGVVFEIVHDREVPIEHAWVYCELCGEETHSGMYTDDKGFYTFKGVWDNNLPISVIKQGYQDPRGTDLPDGYVRREVTVNGDTRFNIQLARK